MVEGANGQLKAEESREFQLQREAEMLPKVIKISAIDDRNNQNIPEVPEFSRKSNDKQKVLLCYKV